MNPQGKPIRKAIRFLEYPLFSARRQTQNPKKEEKIQKSWLETPKSLKRAQEIEKSRFVVAEKESFVGWRECFWKF